MNTATASLRKSLLTFVCFTTALLLPAQSALGISAADLHSALTHSELYSTVNNCSATTTVGSGSLPSSVPAPYNGIFTAAANKYNVPPALVAAIFYGGEHGNSWPPPTGDSNGHWANSGVGPAWPDGVVGARGPFQFEYATWQTYGVDGNNDGQKDPDNLVDAAYGAANYLAASGGKLPNPNLQQAIFAYNPAQFYVNNVIAAYKKFGGTAGLGLQTIEDLTSQSAYAAATPPPNPVGGSDTLNGYSLPATKGGTGLEQHLGTYALGTARSPDEEKYYISMRWMYTSWNWDGTNTGVDSAQFSFMQAHHPRLIVTDPKTNKSIIADALESGPGPWTGVDTSPNNNPKEGWVNPQSGTPPTYRGRVSGFPPEGMQALGATQRMSDGSGDDLLYAWDNDQTDPLGPTTKSVSGYNSNSSGSCDAAAAGSVDGGTILQIATQEYSKHPMQWDSTILGYTDNVQEPWCADFVSWVFKQAGHPFGVGSSWKISGAVDVEKWFQQNGTWVDNKPGGPPPQPGDVYYINYANGATGGGNDHTGIVVSVNGSDLKTINGDWGGSIGYQTYPNYQQNTQLIGWGRLK